MEAAASSATNEQTGSREQGAGSFVNELTIWTQALVGVSLVTLWEVHTDAVVGAGTWITSIDLFAMWSGKTAAALALILLHRGIRVTDALAGTVGVLPTIIGFRGHL